MLCRCVPFVSVCFHHLSKRQNRQTNFFKWIVYTQQRIKISLTEEIYPKFWVIQSIHICTVGTTLFFFSFGGFSYLKFSSTKKRKEKRIDIYIQIFHSKMYEHNRQFRHSLIFVYAICVHISLYLSFYVFVSHSIFRPLFCVLYKFLNELKPNCVQKAATKMNILYFVHWRQSG